MAKIELFDFTTLSNFRKILESKGGLDLVNITQRRRINLDYDYKRQLVVSDDGIVTPFTEPHRDIQEMLRHRSAMERIRKRGVEARPELVLRQVAVDESKLRRRGGDEVTVARQFLRGLFQGRFDAANLQMSYREMASVINDIWEEQNLMTVSPRTWNRTHLKNKARGGVIWAPGCFVPTPRLEMLIKALCESFGADQGLVWRLLFDLDAHEDYSAALVEHVSLAVLFGPVTGISPFAELRDMGHLPGLETLKGAFSCLTPLMLKRLTPERFNPGSLPSSDLYRLTYMFHHLGVPWRYCKVCARVLARPVSARPCRGKNPSASLCVDAFVQALSQSQVCAAQVKTGFLIARLQQFGMNRNRLYRLRKTKFHSNSIKDTPANRSLIVRLARSVGLNPQLFLAALLAPSG